jgi:hypothetical protein
MLVYIPLIMLQPLPGDTEKRLCVCGLCCVTPLGYVTDFIITLFEAAQA